MKIAVDFDGTIVEHRYPEIGKELPFATETLKALIKDQHLDDAVEWCRERGVEFWCVNKNFPEETEENIHYHRKINADVFIDDSMVGGMPDWGEIYQMIKEGKSYRQILRGSLGMPTPDQKPKKKHWWNL